MTPAYPSRFSIQSPADAGRIRVCIEEEERLSPQSPVSSNASPAERVAFEEEEQGSVESFTACGEAKVADFAPTKWPVGQVVKTAASHAANRSSTLLRVTKPLTNAVQYCNMCCTRFARS